MQRVIDGQEMPGGQFVRPLDLDGVISACLDGGAGKSISVAPESSWLQIPVSFGVNFAHRQPVGGDARTGSPADGDGRNHKPVYKRLKFGRAQSGAGKRGFACMMMFLSRQ